MPRIFIKFANYFGLKKKNSILIENFAGAGGCLRKCKRKDFFFFKFVDIETNKQTKINYCFEFFFLTASHACFKP